MYTPGDRFYPGRVPHLTQPHSASTTPQFSFQDALHTLSLFSAFWFSVWPRVGRFALRASPWFVSALRAYVMERLRLHWPVRRRGRVCGRWCFLLLCDFNNLKKHGQYNDIRGSKPDPIGDPCLVLSDRLQGRTRRHAYDLERLAVQWPCPEESAP